MDCFNPEIKVFERLDGDYAIAMIDHVLKYDPYRKEIDAIMKAKIDVKKNSNKKNRKKRKK